MINKKRVFVKAQKKNGSEVIIPLKTWESFLSQKKYLIEIGNLSSAQKKLLNNLDLNYICECDAFGNKIEDSTEKRSTQKTKTSSTEKPETNDSSNSTPKTEEGMVISSVKQSEVVKNKK